MTYSVVARCPKTGRLGVGVQSFYPFVASRVTWARSGAGAVATQAEANPMYGVKGLDLMTSGVVPRAVLEKLLAEDPMPASRQLGFVDAAGNVAAHTGEKCIGHASHAIGDGVVFLANAMRNEGAPEAMARSWADTAGDDLERRLLDALIAAENAGGDLRGMQSAGIRVVDPVSDGIWWDAVSFDIRVDSHPEPLVELEWLLDVRSAYKAAGDGEKLAKLGDVEGAEALYERATEYSPASIEPTFWHAVEQANAGRLESARALFQMTFALDEAWRELARRLPSVGLLRVDEDVLADLVAGSDSGRG